MKDVPLEIKDSEWPKDQTNLQIRYTARGVFFDENKLIPILNVKKYKFHKIPGEGIELGENKEKALRREVFEEAGSDIKISKKIGIVIEYRSKWNFKQFSYGYIGEIISKGTPKFTDEELDEGFELTWMILEEAIKIFNNDKPINYDGWFVKQRDLFFLEKARELTC